MDDLTETQLRGLIELCAACDERLRYYSGEWVRTIDLSGTKEERSSANMRSLMALGLAEGKKQEGHKQQQWSWRITEAGRAALKENADDSSANSP